MHTLPSICLAKQYMCSLLRQRPRPARGNTARPTATCCSASCHWPGLQAGACLVQAQVDHAFHLVVRAEFTPQLTRKVEQRGLVAALLLTPASAQQSQTAPEVAEVLVMVGHMLNGRCMQIMASSIL